MHAALRGEVEAGENRQTLLQVDARQQASWARSMQRAEACRPRPNHHPRRSGKARSGLPWQTKRLLQLVLQWPQPVAARRSWLALEQRTGDS